MSSSDQTYSSYTSADIDAIQAEDIALNTHVAIALNEPLANHIFNRCADLLLSNDLALYGLYKKIFSLTNIKDWSANATYNVGDFVWYVEDSKLYLLKCIVNLNTRKPDIRLNKNTPIESFLKNSGWDNKNKYLTVVDYGIESYLQSIVRNSTEQHEEDKKWHPFGKVSLDPSSSHYIGNVLLQNDMSNIDVEHAHVVFPRLVYKIDSGNVIVTGYMRNYGHLLEYDIVLKLASDDDIQQNLMFDMSSELSANTLKLSLYAGLTKNSVSYQENSNYFLNTLAMGIFSPSLPESEVYTSRVGSSKQHNRNRYVNTYAAKIDFPLPFADRKYMVFTNSLLSLSNGKSVDDGHFALVPSSNDIGVCNKTRESITLVDIMFSGLQESSSRAKHSGLAANSFHCKVIGTIGNTNALLASNYLEDDDGFDGMMTLEWNYGQPRALYGIAPYSSHNKTAITLGAWVLVNGSKNIDSEAPVDAPMFGWNSTGSWREDVGPGGLNIGIDNTGTVSYSLGTLVPDVGYEFKYTPDTSPIGKWVHLAAVWTTSSAKFYYNGVLVYECIREMSFGDLNAETFRCIMVDSQSRVAYANSSIACIFAFLYALPDEQIAAFAAKKSMLGSGSDMWFGYNVINEKSTSSLQNVVEGGSPLTIVNGNEDTVRWNVELY